MRIMVCLAALMALLLLTAPAATAASTTLTVHFSNQTKAPVDVNLWRGGDFHSKTAKPGKAISLETQDTAKMGHPRSYLYSFKARSRKPGNINCSGRIVVGNIVQGEPVVINCGGNVIFGNCLVRKQTHTLDTCTIELTTKQ